MYKSIKDEIPPQGVKILWSKRGDVFVAQRFDNRYFCVQPGEANILDKPDFWAICPVPPPYTGILKFLFDGTDEPITVDELEKRYPKEYKCLLRQIKDLKWDDEKND